MFNNSLCVIICSIFCSDKQNYIAILFQIYSDDHLHCIYVKFTIVAYGVCVLLCHYVYDVCALYDCVFA